MNNSRQQQTFAWTYATDDSCVRREFWQAVSVEHKMVAFSRCDGNIVSMVSNADASAVSSVTGIVGNKDVGFPAPICVPRYNNSVQGVDRLHQLRETKS